MILTKPQRQSLHKLYLRWVKHDFCEAPGWSYRQFRRKVTVPPAIDCIMIECGKIWIGIEPDGYTHT